MRALHGQGERQPRLRLGVGELRQRGPSADRPGGIFLTANPCVVQAALCQGWKDGREPSSAQKQAGPWRPLIPLRREAQATSIPLPSVGPRTAVSFFTAV